MTEFAFDEQASRNLEAVYLTPDVVAQRRQVLEALHLAPGERVIDIGSGPGLLASEMAAVVGETGRVCGVDPSAAMVAIASRRCAAQPWVEFRAGSALELPYPDAGFDLAVSTQVLEFVADIPGALAEIRRILRPGGRVAILDTDYGSLVIQTDDPARMARVLDAWDEHFVHPHLPRMLGSELRRAGFALRQAASIPMFNAEYRDDTYAKGMLKMIAAFAPGRRGVSQAEADAWVAEFAELDAEGRFFFSINRYLFIAEKQPLPDARGSEPRA
ncbi:MAG TPA: methyltransferase domain-containing protein [Bryobacteraceae bacterium]|nr:methyltransferase domain-containing protein [Bryobacteraceae bacterium]